MTLRLKKGKGKGSLKSFLSLAAMLKEAENGDYVQIGSRVFVYQEGNLLCL